MDTRTRVTLLLDYTEYYGEVKTIFEARELIKDLPSESLVNYISGININLYLKEFDEDFQNLQVGIAKNLLSQIGPEAEEKFIANYQKQFDGGHTPIIFWNYTNLKFYDLIFEDFNSLPVRPLTSPEIQKMFDAYLILNAIANQRVSIDQAEIDEAMKDKIFDNLLMANFIYQKDYASTIDYANQVTRGVLFFSYLENDERFGPQVGEFYQQMNVPGYLALFRNLMVLFTEIGIQKKHRKQVTDLNGYAQHGIVDLDYLETLCINGKISDYKADQSFTTLRKAFMYKISTGKYYILDVNFMIDQFYKAQVFAFNAFLKKKKITSDFLSIKGQNFSDRIYLPQVMKTSFPDYITFFGDDCRNSSNEELCDAYIRDGNKIILIEFKDVLLNANIKNGADQVKLFAEFNTKFVENQTGKPKGLSQLKIAINDVDKNSVKFDSDFPTEALVIYPVIVYTDLAFGTDGLNKMYRQKFSKDIAAMDLKNISVRDLTFINLNFFELRQDYFASKITDIFDFLDKYQDHVKIEQFLLTTFEVFSRSYTKDNFPQELGQSKIYLKYQKEIVNSVPQK